jgi:hypothetical protein
VETSVQFDTYRRWLGATAASRPEVRVINATEGGAYIDSMVHQPLREALAALPSEVLDVDGILKRAGELGETRTRKKAVEKLLTDTQSSIARVVAETQQCKKVAAQTRRRPDDLTRLDKAEQRLNAEVQKAPFISVLTAHAADEWQRAGVNARSLDESLDASLELYSAIEQAVAQVRPGIAEALRAVREVRS